jgi:hypothetical protein
MTRRRLSRFRRSLLRGRNPAMDVVGGPHLVVPSTPFSFHRQHSIETVGDRSIGQVCGHLPCSVIAYRQIDRSRGLQLDILDGLLIWLGRPCAWARTCPPSNHRVTARFGSSIGPGRAHRGPPSNNGNRGGGVRRRINPRKQTCLRAREGGSGGAQPPGVSSSRQTFTPSLARCARETHDCAAVLFACLLGRWRDCECATAPAAPVLRGHQRTQLSA